MLMEEFKVECGNQSLEVEYFNGDIAFTINDEDLTEDDTCAVAVISKPQAERLIVALAHQLGYWSPDFEELLEGKKAA